MRTLRIVGTVTLGGGWLAAAVWFFASPRIETLVAYLGASGSFLALDVISRARREDDDPRRHDKVLLEAFRSELPYRPTIEFFRTNNLGSTFHAQVTSPLDEFASRWTDAAHEFNNRVLESRRKALVQAARNLVTLTGELTWDIGGGRQSVKGAAGESRAVWEERGRKLDAAADVVVAAHQSLERAGNSWAAVRVPREWVALLFAVIVLTFPSVGLWKSERNKSAALADALLVTRHERDSLATRLDSLLRARSQPSAASDGRQDSLEPAHLRAIRERLGRFVGECDSLLARQIRGGGPPSEADAERLAAKVRGYLRRSGLDASYGAEFSAALDPLTAALIQVPGNASPLLQRQRGVLLKFLDVLR